MQSIGFEILCALTFKVENSVQEHFFKLLKYNLSMNLNILCKLFIIKKFLYLNKGSSQRWWTITIKYCHLKHYVSIILFIYWNGAWAINFSFHLVYLKYAILWYSMSRVKWDQLNIHKIDTI